MGRFVYSTLVQKAFAGLQLLSDDGGPASHLRIADFLHIRDCLMLCVMLENACRTTDIINMRVSDWQSCVLLTEDEKTHLVYVLEHKTAKSKVCAVNFYGDLYEHSKRYVEVFGDVFLRSGFLFPTQLAMDTTLDASTVAK